ncbi:MAG: hypothetical protein AB1Z98_11850 [Nannocystaceae bacterium]
MTGSHTDLALGLVVLLSTACPGPLAGQPNVVDKEAVVVSNPENIEVRRELVIDGNPQRWFIDSVVDRKGRLFCYSISYEYGERSDHGLECLPFEALRSIPVGEIEQEITLIDTNVSGVRIDNPTLGVLCLSQHSGISCVAQAGRRAPEPAAAP